MQELINYVLKHNGVTLNERLEIQELNIGYIVALDKELEDFCGIQNFEKLAQKKLRKFAKLAQQKGCLLGLWVDRKGQRVYFDLVENVESLAEALNKGKQRRQKAIYDCVNKEEILV